MQHDNDPKDACKPLAIADIARDELAVMVEEDGVVVIAGSRAGMLALADALKRYAETALEGEHVHLEPFDGLHGDSSPVIIELGLPPEAAEPAFEN